MLRKHRTKQNAERLRAGTQWPNSGLVFTTELGRPVDPRNFLRVVEDAAKSADIAGIRVHTLRHSVGLKPLCTSRRSPTCSATRSIAIAGDIYGNTSDDTARAAVDGWSGVLGL